MSTCSLKTLDVAAVAFLTRNYAAERIHAVFPCVAHPPRSKLYVFAVCRMKKKTKKKKKKKNWRR